MKIFKIIILILIIFCLTANVSYSQDSITTVLNNHQSTDNNTIPDINKIFSKKLIDDNTLNILNNYLDLKLAVKEANVRVPTSNGFIPQGITLVGSNYFITGYYETHKNSSCYIVDELGDIINIVELDTNSHVGSISYDKKRNLLWIPDNDGILNAYNSTDFLEKKEVHALYKFDYVSQGLSDFQNSSKKLIAYLCVDGDYIYVGNFFIDYECTVKKYHIVDNDEGIILNYVNKFKLPKRTQSIVFVEYNERKYMLLSQSYRRRNSSYLYVYQYDESKEKYSGMELKKIEIPPMLEQISVYNNSVYLLFESNASKYWNCPEKIEFIITINLLDLLNVN